MMAGVVQGFVPTPDVPVIAYGHAAAALSFACPLGHAKDRGDASTDSRAPYPYFNGPPSAGHNGPKLNVLSMPMHSYHTNANLAPSPSPAFRSLAGRVGRRRIPRGVTTPWQ